MKKTVYLHIGLPKTATTLIQNAFYQSPDVLGQYGVRYLSAGTKEFGDPVHHMLFMAVFGEKGRRIDPSKSSEQIETAWQEALDELATAPEDKIFISSELFALEMTAQEDLIRLRDGLKDYDVKIVLVLRDVADFVNSFYAQLVRDGFSGKVEEKINQIWSSLNWASLTDRWISVFGAENVIPIRFEDLKRGSIVDEFFKLVFGLEYEEPLFENPGVNRSLSHSAVVFLRDINSTDIPEEEKTAFRHQIHTFLGKYKTGLKSADFLDDEVKVTLQKHCVWPPLRTRTQG